MDKYFIYCSNNQAYHALIQNSIVAKTVMRDDFRSDTVSYLSKDYVFITKSELPEEVRFYGVSDAYYPVTLEVEFDESTGRIPARLVTLSADGEVDVLEQKQLADYDNTENVIGAFVCGEIPIVYLSGIIFANEEQKASFKKSSLDLWFPEELHRVYVPSEVSENISIEVLKGAAGKVDQILSENEATEVRNTVIKRNRVKAASYYAIEATKEWNVGTIRSNIDAEIIGLLDKDENLRKTVEKSFSAIKEETILFVDFMAAKDKVLDVESSDVNRNLFVTIIRSIMESSDVRKRISEETFGEIGRRCIDAAGEDKQSNVINSFKVLSTFLSSNMDPDEALNSMGEYDVLRAFMMFMDQQENADFLKRAASKLSQNERRYAYIMYGILNGMSEVERALKANRALEYRIEEKVLSLYENEHLICMLPEIKSSTFMSGYVAEKGEVNGLVVSLNTWYDCKSSQEKLLASNDSKILEKIYLAMVKSSKDDPIPEQDIYSYAVPVVIKVTVGDDVIESFEIKRKKDAKDYGKKIEKALKSVKEEFNAEGFKKYLAEEKRYQKFYRKNMDVVQEYCRKV